MFDRDNSGVLDKMEKPVVMAYSTSMDENISSVTYENEPIAFQLAQHLFEYGHKNIAVITGLAHTAPAQKRMDGINRAFSQAGLVLDSRLIRYGDWERSSGYSCMMSLLEQNQGPAPTAVIAMNDLMAIGAMDAIRDAKLTTPDDISVVGFDNREISDFVYPRLTTVEIDLKGIGYAAAEMIDHRLSGQGLYSDQKHITIPSKLIERNSVAKLTNK
jgi:LacI family transcriptional regulator